MGLTYKQRFNAVLTGAGKNVKRTLRVPIGWQQTDTKEKELSLSIPIPGNASDVDGAINVLASLPYTGDAKQLVRVGMPRTSGAGETRLILSPRMVPARLACLVCFLTGRDMPKNIAEKDATAHLSACGIETEASQESETETADNRGVADALVK